LDNFLGILPFISLLV